MHFFYYYFFIDKATLCYNICMTKNSDRIKYIAASAPDKLCDYIESKGYRIEKVPPLNCLPRGISEHPDIRYCRLGISSDARIIEAPPGSIGAKYPADIAYNAACTGRYLICNAKFTAPDVLSAPGFELIDVKQGYAKCSIVIVDESSIITYDQGVALEALSHGLDVLTISPGHVILEGYNTGFIGGTSGRVEDEIIFNGNLSTHPDFERIKEFIECRGLKCTYFEEWPLTDIGSIV